MDEKLAVSLNKLNASFKDALATHSLGLADKAHAQAAAGLSASDIDMPGDFCAACAKIKPFVNMALRGASWLAPPSMVAIAKSVLGLFFDQIVPAICKK